jgi:outer membrane receptor for monomeric catechols
VHHLSNPSGANAPWNSPEPASAIHVNKIDTIALYGFDTLKFNEQWLLNRACAWTTTSLGFRPCRRPCANAYPAYDLSAATPCSTTSWAWSTSLHQWQHLRQHRHLFAPGGLLWATAAKT